MVWKIDLITSRIGNYWISIFPLEGKPRSYVWQVVEDEDFENAWAEGETRTIREAKAAAIAAAGVLLG